MYRLFKEEQNKSKYLDEYVTEEQVINTNMSEKRHINEFEKSEMYIDLSNALLKMSERDKELLTYLLHNGNVIRRNFPNNRD